MVFFEQARRDFHSELTKHGVLCIDKNGVASNADTGQKGSKDVALVIAKALGAPTVPTKLDGQTAGDLFEKLFVTFVRNTFTQLNHLRPGIWEIRHIRGRDKIAIAEFEQYAHLAELAALARVTPALAIALGSDYAIAPDILVIRGLEKDAQINSRAQLVDAEVTRLASLREVNGGNPILHASISCKWTLRSDRAQNARSEALNLVKNRKGRLPHVVVVTGEPMPARIASVALGTGEIDCVYHFALYELKAALTELQRDDSLALLETMIVGKRLKDISDLPLDLAV